MKSEYASTLRLACCLTAGALLTAQVTAAPKFILISLDGATPRFVDQYLADGSLPANAGLGLLQNRGFKAQINETVSPSLTAVGHIAIATGSKAAKNDVLANSFHLVASPFTFNISGFGAPVGGYCIDCGPQGGPGMSPSPTAELIWERLRVVGGRKVVTATWPGGDGIDVRVPGASNNAIVQASAERTVDYTVPFGAFAGVGAQGFSLSAANFGPAPQETLDQLTAAGKVSFSPVMQKTTLLESFNVGGASHLIQVGALDTTDDGTVNYDTLVFFDAMRGIEPGPFNLPSTGPAYVKAGEKQSSPFYLEGSSSKAGCGFYVSQLAPDLSTVRICRYSANSIPRNAAVLADVDDVNNNVGFWAPQPDFRIPERLSPGFGPFPDIELEEIYADLVRRFTDYQTRLALRAISRVPDADLVMIYFEQPDGSGHQFLLTDPRQPTDFLDPNSIGAGQDPDKMARYASYLKFAYQAANQAVQRVVDAVGSNAEGKPNSNIIVTSDHGFEIFHTAVNMNALLAANAIPSSKVRAVTSGPAVNLYINLQGREPNGTVTKEEFITLQQQIVSVLEGLLDTNLTYTLGAPSVQAFDKIYSRPLPVDVNDPAFGRGTSEFIGQDSGDVHALLSVGYNFDGTQVPVVVRQGDAAPAPPAIPIFSVPNFYGAHGYDPTLPNLSSIFFAAGPDIGRGVLPKVRNIDLAPTIAAMLGVEPYVEVDGNPLPIGPLELVSAASRKWHGRAGAFDVEFPLDGSIGVECREGLGWFGGTHLLVFTFNKPIARADAWLSKGSDGRVFFRPIIDGSRAYLLLTDVDDEQVLTLRLTDVKDIYGGKLDATVKLGFLSSDVTGNGVVDAADVAFVRSEVGDAVGAENFRADVTLNGKINSTDVTQTRIRLGNSLP